MKPKIALRNTIVELYQQGLTVRQVANVLGFKSCSNITYHLKRAGLSGRKFDIGKLNKGRSMLAATKEKISVAGKLRVGPLSGGWKGGLTSEAKKFYSSTEWKITRDNIFARDNYTCQLTGIRGGELECHHIIPRSKLPKEQWLDQDNLITLSKEAHKLTKGKESKFQKLFTS